MDDESIRTQKEKSYIDDQTFNLFVDDSLDDKEYFQRLDQIAYAYELLRESEIVSSKSQFCGAIASMQKLLVPLKEAAAICQVTPQSFRRLEHSGRVKLVRMKPKNHVGRAPCFVRHQDILKYLKARA